MPYCFFGVFVENVSVDLRIKLVYWFISFLVALKPYFKRRLPGEGLDSLVSFGGRGEASCL